MHGTGKAKISTLTLIGIYRKQNGFSYNGAYKLNMKHGFGTTTYPNGGRYEGEFADNKKNGKGKLVQ